MESASMGDGTSGERIAAGQSDRRVRVPSQSAERAAPNWPARTLCHTPPLVRAFASRSIHNAAIRSDRDGRWSLVRHRRGPGEDARGRGRSCCPCWPPRDALEQVADSIRERGREAFPIVIDLTADASLANLVERARPELGPIDILINDAGFAVTWGMSFRVQTGLTFLQVEEVVEIVRFLLHTGENVKLGPEILVRTMRNPMPA